MIGRDFAAECLRIAETQIGVTEHPPGSNTGPEIREYLSGCERDVDRDGDLDPLGLTSGEWCASFACWCSTQALKTLPDSFVPHFYRASGIELIRDAEAAGNWISKETFLGGVRSPWVGDLVLWDRSEGLGWQRHVARFHSWHDVSWTSFLSVGGNENNRVQRSEHLVSDPHFLGFISYFQGDPESAIFKANS